MVRTGKERETYRIKDSSEEKVCKWASMDFTCISKGVLVDTI